MWQDTAHLCSAVWYVLLLEEIFFFLLISLVWDGKLYFFLNNLNNLNRENIKWCFWHCNNLSNVFFSFLINHSFIFKCGLGFPIQFGFVQRLYLTHVIYCTTRGGAVLLSGGLSFEENKLMCGRAQNSTVHRPLTPLGYQPDGRGYFRFLSCEYSAKHGRNMTSNLQINPNYSQLDEPITENKHARGQFIFFLVLTLLLGTETVITAFLLYNFSEDIQRVREICWP